MLISSHGLMASGTPFFLCLQPIISSGFASLETRVWVFRNAALCVGCGDDKIVLLWRTWICLTKLVPKA